MARIPRAPKEPTLDAFDSFMGASPKPVKKKTLGNAAVKRYVKATTKLIEHNEWGAFKISNVVALHMWCHSRVYGVDALELEQGAEFEKARIRAGQLMKKQFGGELPALVDYVKWVWRDENRREQWRRKNGHPGKVLGWRLVFGPHKVVEYRIEQRRRTGDQ